MAKHRNSLERRRKMFARRKSEQTRVIDNVNVAKDILRGIKYEREVVNATVFDFIEPREGWQYFTNLVFQLPRP